MDEHTASELGYKRGLDAGMQQLSKALTKKITKRMEFTLGVTYGTYAEVLDLIRRTTMELSSETESVHIQDDSCPASEKNCIDPFETCMQSKPAVLTVEDIVPKRYVVDFEICCTVQELKLTLADINRYGYPLAAITQCEDAYTVFFRRPVDGLASFGRSAHENS